MKLNTRALAIACAIFWGVMMLIMGVANVVWSGYGEAFLQLMASVYPGYHATHSVGQAIVGALYGAGDGLIGGAIFGWLYNLFVK
jgi:hypothetical protein